MTQKTKDEEKWGREREEEDRLLAGENVIGKRLDAIETLEDFRFDRQDFDQKYNF